LVVVERRLYIPIKLKHICIGQFRNFKPILIEPNNLDEVTVNKIKDWSINELLI